MRFSPLVNRTGVSPVLWFHLPMIDYLHYLHTGHELLVRSMREALGRVVHSPRSGDDVLAADLDRYELDEVSAEMAGVFCHMLNVRFDRVLRVVLEPEWLTPAELEERGGKTLVVPHIHVQVENEVFSAVRF